MICKTAVIAVTGPPNAGKSTLVNTLVGEKVAIVTPKPQTTRTRIMGVANTDETQFVLIDTPGFHKARTVLGEYMLSVVRRSITGADGVVFLIEPGTEPGEREKELIVKISESKIPCVLAVNKIDTVRKEALLPVIESYSAIYEWSAVVPISAKRKDGIDVLKSELEKFAEEGPPLFPDGMITDQPESRLFAEILREKLLYCLDKEVPHGIATEISGFSERENGIIDLSIMIYCEKRSHKGIIIGKNGAVLKRAGELARCEIESFTGAKVFLQTHVKVKENWRDSKTILRSFGFGE
ncbi:MAG: GTPase Era [Oscillospiraceae bacterium]|nr:GTPase Era [Oscillospiraceae bacterium]